MDIINIVFGIFILGIFAGVLTFSIMLIKKNRRFNGFTCIVWKKDGFGQLVQELDQAGVFVEKVTNNKRLYLKKANVGLSPDDIPYIPCGKTKFVFLFRTGLKNFQFIKPIINNEGIVLRVGEEDVNWALNSYYRVKKAFEKKNWIEKVLPYMLFALLIIGFIVMVIFILKKFDVFVELAKQLNNVAQTLLKAQAGTVVIE